MATKVTGADGKVFDQWSATEGPDGATRGLKARGPFQGVPAWRRTHFQADFESARDFYLEDLKQAVRDPDPDAELAEDRLDPQTTQAKGNKRTAAGDVRNPGPAKKQDTMEARERYQARGLDEDGKNALMDVLLEVQRGALETQETWEKMTDSVVEALASTQPQGRAIMNFANAASICQRTGMTDVADVIRRVAAGLLAKENLWHRTSAERIESWKHHLMGFNEGEENQRKREEQHQRMVALERRPPPGQLEHESQDSAGAQREIICLDPRNRKFVKTTPNVTLQGLKDLWEKGNRYDEYGRPWKRPKLFSLPLGPRVGLNPEEPEQFGRFLLVRVKPGTQDPDPADGQKQLSLDIFYNADYQKYTLADRRKRPYLMEPYSKRYVLVSFVDGVPHPEETEREANLHRYVTENGTPWKPPTVPVLMPMNDNSRIFVYVLLNENGQAAQADIDQECERGRVFDHLGNPFKNPAMAREHLVEDDDTLDVVDTTPMFSKPPSSLRDGRTPWDRLPHRSTPRRSELSSTAGPTQRVSLKELGGEPSQKLATKQTAPRYEKLVQTPRDVS
jgi:hypothetical protein